MEAVEIVAPAPAPAFRRWGNDLHRAEVVLRTGGGPVPAIVEDRRADGTLVLSAGPAATAELTDGRPLALLFRVDERRRRRVAPVRTTDWTADRETGRIEARFVVDPVAERQHLLAEMVPGRLESRVLFRRSRSVHVVRLSLYSGELVVDDPGTTLAPGMVVTLALWVPWIGERHMRVQLTSYREEIGGRCTFRVVDRASVRTAAVVLAGSAEDFDYSDLRAASVRPQRMTRHLRVHTVSDDVSFHQALGLRLVSNRSFGRLADVADPESVADHLDPHSSNFVITLGSKAVGAGRVVVNGGDRSLSEIETDTGGLPEHLWQGGFVEVSRVVIHPDYRSSGVAVALFREVARLAFAVGARYLVLDAIQKLVPMYEKVGARKLPIVKTHPYSRETVYVMAIDVGEQLGHVDRRSVSWQYVFGPVLRHHLTTSPSRPLDGFADGRRLPYWIKKTVSRPS